MDIAKIIDVLRTALDSKDWDLIKSLLEQLSYGDDGDFSDYLTKDDDDWYIRDLLCDIKHFCHKNKINFDNELDKADHFFVEEINEKRPTTD